MVRRAPKRDAIGEGGVDHACKVRFIPNFMADVNGGLILSCRNSELHPARSAMREVEDRFNKRFGYPWVFVNDEPFTDEYDLSHLRRLM